jgi:hypothetical protein
LARRSKVPSDGAAAGRVLKVAAVGVVAAVAATVAPLVWERVAPAVFPSAGAVGSIPGPPPVPRSATPAAGEAGDASGDTDEDQPGGSESDAPGQDAAPLEGDAAWAEGALPEGTTVFDDGYPGVANLDPALLRALREAGTAAGADGIGLQINSGWRAAAYQERLLRDAVAEYGSEAEAARWVATPETSEHVAGGAVDVGPAEAWEWLARRGAGYGLCQIYDNEPWHYELRPEAARDGCPARYADPTQDPRMRP